LVHLQRVPAEVSHWVSLQSVSALSHAGSGQSRRRSGQVPCGVRVRVQRSSPAGQVTVGGLLKSVQEVNSLGGIRCGLRGVRRRSQGQRRSGSGSSACGPAVRRVHWGPGSESESPANSHWSPEVCRVRRSQVRGQVRFAGSAGSGSGSRSASHSRGPAEGLRGRSPRGSGSLAGGQSQVRGQVRSMGSGSPCCQSQSRGPQCKFQKSIRSRRGLHAQGGQVRSQVVTVRRVKVRSHLQVRSQGLLQGQKEKSCGLQGSSQSLRRVK
jgi:hypothetical protein